MIISITILDISYGVGTMQATSAPTRSTTCSCCSGMTLCTCYISTMPPTTPYTSPTQPPPTRIVTHVLSTSISRRFSVLVYIRCSRLPAVTAPNPNVAPLPALHEATLTASPTQKLQKHSQHDPITYTRLGQHHPNSAIHP